MKKGIAFALAVSIVLMLVPGSAAHSTKQSGTIAWGENCGWDIDENNHNSGTTVYYKFDNTDTYLTTTMKAYVTGGAALWSGTVTISESITPTGTVTTYSYPNDGYEAKFSDFSSNVTTGHLTTWKIQINRAYTTTNALLAHEFGHAIGLKDLTSFANADKLMYGYSTKSATAPTTADINGAKVITGSHTTHTWGYRYSMTLSIGLKCHQQYCTVCDGFVPGHTVCMYNAQNICTSCGTPK
ncbi:MAG: hypothetical protein FWG31_09040 [Oscillospiraceae bacterium]|nr:hypothetical protein [Oscillospiraceae bacterium]